VNFEFLWRVKIDVTAYTANESNATSKITFKTLNQIGTPGTAAMGYNTIKIMNPKPPMFG
jgi:hypothetical protein